MENFEMKVYFPTKSPTDMYAKKLKSRSDIKT